MKRGLYRAEAVILNSFDYGESDRILTFYTLEYGKIKAIAKGARRSRRRFVGNLEPTSLVRIIFFHSDKSDLVRVDDATLLEGFNTLKADIDLLSHGCYFVELASELTREGVAMPHIFRLLAGFLKMLDAGAEPGPLARFFEVRLLSMAGYLPHLSGCVVCKSPGGALLLRFSSERGGAVCSPCSSGIAGLHSLSPATAATLNLSMKLDAEKLQRLKVAPSFVEESERLLYDFIRHQIGKELKTKKFIEKMKSAELARETAFKRA